MASSSESLQEENQGNQGKPDDQDNQPQNTRDATNQPPEEPNPLLMIEMMKKFFHYCQQSPRNPDVGDRTFERFLRYNPPKFLGTPDATQAESWMTKIRKIFSVHNYSDEQKINLATYQFEDAAYDWWRVIDHQWSRNKTPRTWDNFTQEFKDKYIPQVVQNTRDREFMDLVQGSMTVAQYEAEFHRLIHYAPHFMEDELRKTRKFVQGLNLEIRWSTLSTEATNYNITVNQALRVEAEMKTLLKREETEKKTKTSNFTENNQKKRKFEREFQPDKNGGPRRQNFQEDHNNQKCGYCGLPNHNEDKCWRKNGKCLVCGSEQHRIQEFPKRSQQTSSAPKTKIPARAYALMGKDEEVDPTAVVEGKFFLLSKVGKALFDPGATHSFVSSTFLCNLNLISSKLPYFLEVSSPMGNKISSDVLYKDCPLEINKKIFYVDLVELPIQGYDIILGMDWLFRHQALLNCYTKEIKLNDSGEAMSGNHNNKSFSNAFISALEAHSIIKKGGQGFLAYLFNKPKDQLRVSEIPIVQDFSEVFPEEINSLPPHREIEFTIE
ncbi:uncharacterized protein [Henckelia pumila]|uniref:uncharacterized protein n=1 Tax=Henckelia pumila TaxID=405737 RepID=UPI003C6E3C83